MLSVRANEQGRLFRAVREETIARALSERAGVPIPERAVALAEPIKSVGEHEVKVAAGGNERVVTIRVEAQEQ